jgi:hypothetical protein
MAIATAVPRRRSWVGPPADARRLIHQACLSVRPGEDSARSRTRRPADIRRLRPMALRRQGLPLRRRLPPLRQSSCIAIAARTRKRDRVDGRTIRIVRPPTTITLATASTLAIATRPIGTRAPTTASHTEAPVKASETTESVDLEGLEYWTGSGRCDRGRAAARSMSGLSGRRSSDRGCGHRSALLGGTLRWHQGPPERPGGRGA